MKPNSAMDNISTLSQRLDTWLWASRFYKTRKLAADAVKAGHVSVNLQRSKPAKPVTVDDVLKIKRFQQEYTVVVKALSEKRLGAPLAIGMYQETEVSIAEREEKNRLMKDQRSGLRYERGRPHRRDRHKMLGIKNQIPDWD